MFIKILILSQISLLMLAGATSNKREDDAIQRKIIGGQSIEINQAPYMAIFSINDIEVVCGAIIIGRRHFLTAAHCLNLEPFNTPIVKVGNTFSRPFTKVYNVTKWIAHPKFDPDILEYDVGVLMISEPLTWSPSVAPIALAEENFIVPEGALISVKGWGITNTTTFSLSNQLQEVQVPVVSQKICSEAYAKLNVTITEKMLCAGTPGKDHCYGDSGGPLTYQYRAVGIISFAEDCALPGYPGVSTKVSAMRSWIDETLCKTDFCGWW